MRNQLKLIIVLMFMLFINNSARAQNKIELSESFNRLIVSPHIETVFVKGKRPSIEIVDISVPIEKFKHEYYNSNTLQVYLEGAKTYTKNNKEEYTNIKRPIYKGRVAKVIITYTDISVFSIRGEEEAVFESPLIQDKCTIRFYGHSKATVKDIKVDELLVEVYGDSFLTLEKGTIGSQKIRAYGASTIMASEVVSNNIKITVYGDGKYQLNASENIKVTAYGASEIMYKGDAVLKKGILIGDSNIIKM